jgi:hypothetical protein
MEAHAPQPSYRILFPLEAELAEVRIGPLYSHLEDRVQVGDGAVTT